MNCKRKMFQNSRSNPPYVFFKVGVLKTFTYFTGKTLESLLNKVAGLSAEICVIFKNTIF